MWTATIIDRATDVEYKNGVKVTVTYTNGSQSATITHRALSSTDQINAVISSQLAAFQQADNLAASVLIGDFTPAPSLTASQVAALKPYFDAVQTDQANMTALNTANVANPVAQTQVPKPLDTTSVLGVLSAASLGNLYGNPSVTTIRTDVRIQDRQAVAQWANLALAAGQITSTERDAVVAQCNATIPDPMWQAQTSRAFIQIGRPVTLADMAQVRSS